jgi:predicted lipid carrier protein YhbT
MTASTHALPPVVALALRPLPLLPLQLLLSVLLDAAVRRHPRIFDRLGAHTAKRYGIDPTDMPFAIVIEPRPDDSRLAVLRDLPADVDTRIAGPLAVLYGLAAGALDGDAMFFSRDLAIEGDVEAILALRNALDDTGVDLAGIAGSLLEAPFHEAARAARPVLSRLVRGYRWS